VKTSNQIPVNKEEIRMPVADIGYKETSKRTGIKYGTLRKWACVYKWNKPITHSQVVTTVANGPQSPAIAHSEALKDLEGQTRLSLAKYARKASQDAEGATLRDAALVHKAAQIASITHQWDKGNSSNTILNLGVLIGTTPSQPDDSAED
jgi:hypothetical protein